MHTFALHDVERMVRLVSEATDPALAAPLQDRKRVLLEGTAELIDADMWIWSMAMLHPDVERDTMSTGIVDGGWRDDLERAAALRVLTDPKFNNAVMGPVVDAIERGRYMTFLRHDLVSDCDWEQVGNAWRKTGYGSLVMSVYPLDNGVYAGIGFHRRVGKPEFGNRERGIVHVIFQQVDWLHRAGSNASAGKFAVQLSPRQRQVLLFLLSGDSRKTIAAKLDLSEHTVGDYLKQIYKQFCVNTRSELLAQFISGGR